LIQKLEIAEEIDIEYQILKQLENREFMIKVGTRPPVKVIMTDKFIGDKKFESDARWKEHRKYSIKKYFKKYPSKITEKNNLVASELVDDNNFAFTCPKCEE